MITDIQTNTKQNSISFKDAIAQFKKIKYQAFSGDLIIRAGTAPHWVFSFSLGRLAGVSGGIDPVNRWQRNLGIACLELPLDRLVRTNIQGEIFLNSNVLAQQSLTIEVLFDIIQFSQSNGDRLSCQLVPISSNNNLPNPGFSLLDIEVTLTKAIKDWQAWRNAGFDKYSPSQFLTIHQPKPIFDDNDNLQYVISSIDGDRSLRSLAIQHQQQLLNFTQALAPLFRSGSIGLAPQPKSKSSQVKDLDGNERFYNQISSYNADEITIRSPAKIACIDDSALIYHHLEQILTASGYRSFGVQDPLKIMPSLIKHKPDFIFLDLLMPITNGYEVCEQIRKTPSLKDVPVVILTGKDGLIDRMRAKIVGANGFITKPVQPQSVLKMLEKHLAEDIQRDRQSWLN
jgi:two-component system, chemotaxis family, response regulator PixG